MTPLRAHGERIRRRAWLVLLITLIAVAGSVWSSLNAGTTYTARATLGISSTGRSPDQDAVLASGYIDMFNDASYLSQVREQSSAPAGVTLAARTAAASPIIYIEASGKNADDVARLAPAAASAFRDDVNAGLKRDRDARVDTIQQEIDKQTAILSTRDTTPQAADLATRAITDLQGRINDIQSDSSNQLQDLQLASGVSASASGLVTSAGLALVGGLILGCLAAIGLAYARNRVETESDVRDRLGVTPLGTIATGRSVRARHERTQQYKRLSNLVASSPKRPIVVAVVSATRNAGTTDVATALARFRAAQGERTLLVHTDPLASSVDDAALPGVVDVLASAPPALLDDAIVAGRDGAFDELPAGCREDDPFAVFTAPRWNAVMEAATSRVDVVVVAVVPLLEAAEGQTICAAADTTVLVVEKDGTHLRDARAALDLLAQVDVDPLGVVLVGPPHSDGRPADPAATNDSTGGITGGNRAVTSGDTVAEPAAEDRAATDAAANMTADTVRVQAVTPTQRSRVEAPADLAVDPGAGRAADTGRRTQPEDAGVRR
ncbi:hypothetical protein [Pseudonocardia sp. N23]|uniref:hypothetical protein n=1 Tax=Pseudonocardia sp. N23 TaxID=1987376 RepID=UPI000C025A0E|nr:hypothetical protein [Pseudonocardia sp. N23]GAY12250.1 tyrosine-protein kinase EpsD [Pseudonocardia sp. N23]